jgi:4-hydroxybenzoate polyprenyltransferase
MIIGGVPLAIAIHLADAIPDRDHDRHAGLVSLPVVLGRPFGEIAAAALVVIGSAVIVYLWFMRFGNGLSGFSMIALAAIYLLITLDARWTTDRWRPPVGKWVLIGDAITAGIILVALA